MLTRLLVRNVVLINTLDLDFTKGLTVLTGETGAGNPFCLIPSDWHWVAGPISG